MSHKYVTCLFPLQALMVDLGTDRFLRQVGLNSPVPHRKQRPERLF